MKALMFVFVLLAGRMEPRPALGDLSRVRRAGAGLGLAFARMSNIIVASVQPYQTGVASGMNTNIRTIGGSIGTAVTPRHRHVEPSR
jgi:hypothetical protein